MTRTMAAMSAAIVVSGLLAGHMAAAGPFPQVPLEDTRQTSHRAAYVCLVAGMGLVGASFAFSQHANQTYEDYLRSSDPLEIRDLFDETERYDRLSSGSLLAGEALIAAGVYLRFLRQPPDAKVAFSLTSRRCALSYRF